MKKSHKLVKPKHKNVNLSDKKSQNSVKNAQKCKFKWKKKKKKPQHSVKKTQKCKFRWQKFKT